MRRIDKIQDYLDGHLAESERKEFEIQLVNDQSLKKEYNAALIASRLSHGLVEMDMREKLAKEGEKRKNLLYGLVAFLIIVVIGVSIYRGFLRNKESPALVAMVYAEPLWPGVRGFNDQLSQAILEFRQGESLEKVKTKILEIEGLAPQEANYWIAEMFLLRSELDSATVYLPDLPMTHIKYSRMLWIRDFIEQNKTKE